MITFVLALALAAPNPASIDAPRHAFQTCLKTFETNQLQGKGCARRLCDGGQGRLSKPRRQALADALVKFDTAMGTKRPAALANAERDVDDYRLTSDERYRDLMAN